MKNVNVFLAWKCGESYVRVMPSLRLKLVKDENSASYWTSKQAFNSWSRAVKHKYPDAQQVQLELKLKTK